MKILNNKQTGFTLIELMIVVAIVGILAAIALPVYKDYQTKTKWADNLATLNVLKIDIAECLQDNAGNSNLCDTVVELTPYEVDALPTLKYSSGPLTITAGGLPGDHSITIKFNGSSEVGGYIYEAQSSLDASGMRLTWDKTGIDTIPDKILKYR